MKNVMTIRDFTRNIYSHIKTEGEYVVTINGKESIVVTIKNMGKPSIQDKIIDDIEDTMNQISSNPTEDETAEESIVDQIIAGKIKYTDIDIAKYACGCKKTDSKLCPKHHRM
jgi:uncharacterized phage-associated protein